jgi:hypothetical protein
VTELVLAGSLATPRAFAEAADQFGDLAVVEVLSNIPPQVTALHMAGFDGGKMSLATLLVPPKPGPTAWPSSPPPGATIRSRTIPSASPNRCSPTSTAWCFPPTTKSAATSCCGSVGHRLGATAFAILFSMAPKEILEVAARSSSRPVRDGRDLVRQRRRAAGHRTGASE